MPRNLLFSSVRASVWALLCLILLCTGSVSAQSGTVLPTRGKRFWTGFMQNGFGAQSLKLHVMGASGTTGTVRIPGLGWNTSFTIAPSGVVVVDVPTMAENSGSETVQPKGVLIEAQDSVNVLISSFQNFTHDMAQILPEGSLGSSYRVDAYQGLPNFNNLHRSELLIVATEDGTEVRITPTVNTAAGRPAGVPFTVVLHTGQSYQVQAAQDNLDLTGTLVEATSQSGSCRPFVVLGGSMCATVPGSCSACDAVFEQLVPRSAWGTRYFTIPVQGIQATTYRIMADENATTVTIGNGAPITLNAGQRWEANGQSSPVCIQANKPISVVQLLEGYSCAGNGDPSLILLSPAERISRTAILHTPTSGQITQHGISIVVPPSAVGQITLNGNPIAANLFQPYAGCADRMHARFAVPAGVHRLQAASGFQAYLVGIGFGESYAGGVHDIRGIAIPQDSVVCGNGPVTLNAPELLSNISWTSNATPTVVLGNAQQLTVNPTSSASYTVTGNNPSSGCPRSFTYHVGVPLTIPTLPTANNGPGASVCQYENVQLGLSPSPDPAWFEVVWSPANSLNDPTSVTPLATPMQDTWYTVSVSSPSGCGSMVDSILVQVAPAQVLSLTASTTRSSVCLGETTQLNSQTLRVVASDRFEVQGNAMWNAIQGGILSPACGSVSGQALYFNGNGQRFAQTVGLNVTGGGQVRFHLKIGQENAPCDNADPGEDVILEYSTNNGFSWVPIITYAENAYPAFTTIQQAIPPAAATANTMFRLRQLANSGAGEDNWAVDELIIARFDNNWLSYAWSPASVASPNAPSTSASPTASGWYVLSGTDPTAGCVYQDSVYIHVDPAFTLTVTADTTLCSVAGLPLSATPSFSTSVQYLWGPANGSLSATDVSSPIATPQQTTTYTVQATTQNGCSAAGSVTVQVGQLIDLQLSASNTVLCQGQSATLSANATGGNGLQYAWTGGGLNATNTPSVVATPAATTTYTVTVTEPSTGCSLSQAVTLTVNTGYTVNAGPDLTLCSTLGHVLQVQHNIPNATFTWQPAANLNGSNIQSPTVLVDATATYTVTVTDANGCSVTDAVTLTRPFQGVPGTQTVSTCASAPPTLNAPAIGVAYAWSTGASTSSIVPTASGAYTVTITDANGCQAISTFQVTLHPLPLLDLGPDVALCGATSHTLLAQSPGNNVTWSTGGSGQQLTVNSSGAYSATATSPQGCTSSDVVQVSLLPLPVNNLQDLTACISQPPTLNAGNPGHTYLWSTGASTSTITPTASGTYSVTITSPAGCSATYSSNVMLMPLVSVELGSDTTLCSGNSLALDAGMPDAAWSTGTSGQFLTVGQPGTYSVTVTNGSCSATDAITVAVLQGPQNNLAPVTSCADTPVTLDAGNAGSAFAWSTGATGQTIQVQATNTYSVTVTSPQGCTATFSAAVQMVAPPVVELGMDTVLCEGQTLLLDAGNPGSSYQWSNGSTARRIQVRQTGTYSVTVSNSHCQRSDAITVLFNPSPARMAQRQVFTCLDEAPRHVILDAGNPGAQFRWDDGSTQQTFRATAYGWVGVDITNTYGCALRDSVLVSEYCTSAVYVPNSFTPNGDGLNDVFIPVGKNIATLHLMIFDRWGALIYETNDVNMGWDGTYRGQPVTNDMFMWRLTYRFFEDEHGTLGMEQELMGHVQVIR